MQGRVMIVPDISAKKAGVFLCREDVRVEGAGGASSATVTLVTHAAAAKAGLEKRMQVAAALAGLGGTAPRSTATTWFPWWMATMRYEW